MIPYGQQDISQNDIDAVVNVLKSKYLTQGPNVEIFEKAISEYTKSKHAIAVNSATSALHIACASLGLGPKDLLWTSPISFVASANCALYCGAKVDFVDIDPSTFNLCMSSLEEKLSKSYLSGRLPKIIITVHMAGQPTNMKELKKLSKKYNFKIIEDASHAIGSRYLNEPTGNCKYSDITVFSFHPVKIITTGEGGAATTNNNELAKKMKLLRTHGITRDLNLMENSSDGPWYYQQIKLGWNYRMTDIQAALGNNQIKRLDNFVKKRNLFAKRYDIELSNLPISLPKIHKVSYSSFHLYIIQINNPKRRTKIFKYLQNAGIGVNVHYIPIHLQPFYKKLGFGLGDFPNAENYYSKAISIPLFSSMTEEQQSTVINKLKLALE